MYSGKGSIPNNDNLFLILEDLSFKREMQIYIFIFFQSAIETGIHTSGFKKKKKKMTGASIELFNAKYNLSIVFFVIFHFKIDLCVCVSWICVRRAVPVMK